MQAAALHSQQSYVLSNNPSVAARGISTRKAKRLRISWFLLGTVAGILLSSGVNYAAQKLFAENEGTVVAHFVPDVDRNSASPSEGEVNEVPEALLPSEFNLTVRKGDTLLDMLTAKGASFNEANSLVDAMRPHYNPRQIAVGQSLHVKMNPQARTTDEENRFAIASIAVKTDATKTLELIQTEKGKFETQTHEAPVSTDATHGGGAITSSLYQTGMNAGVPQSILGSVINAYSYDVDFQRDIHRGDSFNVVYERMRNEEDDSTVGYGDVLYASLVLNGEEKRIYRYETKDGDADFYDEKGQSVRKALLRTPINGARLSSGFGVRRHPILGYNKMHKGVDFAATTGTPVYAAGDGVIEHAGRKGSYGNYVRVKHTSQYATAYAHLSRVAVRAGTRVKQGQVIGYVGSTGASTGPHLHYEVLAGGVQVNPKNVKFQAGRKLEGRELAQFKDTIRQVDLMVARLIRNETTVASAQ